MREERHLSDHLRRAPGVRSTLNRIRATRTLSELETVASELPALIRAITPEYPHLEGPQAGRVDEFGGDMRRLRPGVREPTTRYFVKYVATGDVELLEYWPDQSGQPLRSVHHETMERIGGYRNLQHCSDEDAQEYWRLQPTWQLHAVGDEGPWALYTYFDLTPDEEGALAQTGGLRALVDERYERVAPIITEIQRQAQEFFEVTFPEWANDAVSERERTLANREALLKDLTVPTEWSSDPLELEESVAGASPAGTGSRTAKDVSLDLETMYRLSPKSFADVVSTIRTWADAVERNPAGFGHLNEDGLSDLLAATLNATVPHAGREVFSRSGKVDIHVTADVIAEGSGPAAVFLCETKWATGRAPILEALDEQLFRYLTAHSSSAVLLLLCRQQRFAAAVDRIRGWAREATGYLSTIDGPVEKWPHHIYVIEDRSVEVCIATVAVPLVTTRAGRPK